MSAVLNGGAVLGDEVQTREAQALRTALALAGLLCTKPELMPALYMAVADCDFPDIDKNTKVDVRNKDPNKASYSFWYAELKEILGKVRPVLRAHGLGLVQPVITDELGQPWLTTALLHKDGGVLLSTIKAPQPGDEPKEFGGTLTFMRRYMVNAILCLAADDDADNDTRGRGEDERGDYPAATKRAPVRRSAAPAPTPSADHASAPEGSTAAQEGISEGQFKNLGLKVRAMEVSDDAMAAMLKRLGIKSFDASMSLTDWKALKGALEVAAKAMA